MVRVDDNDCSVVRCFWYSCAWQSANVEARNMYVCMKGNSKFTCNNEYVEFYNVQAIEIALE